MKHSEAFERLVSAVRPHITEIAIEAVLDKQKRGDKFTLIDVREDHEWQSGHAPKAIHIGRGIIERDIEKYLPDFNSEIVLYCGGGYRSALSADSLQKMGYKRVLSMAGGFRGWQALGLPIVKD
jgi:rhodanese-related sulfurtransferase